MATLGYDADLLQAALSLEQASLASGAPPSFEETFARLGWAPFPKQQAVIDAHRAGIYATLFAGAAGPGKSTVARMLAIAFCIRYPGSRAAIFRRTYPELHRTHEIPLMSLPPEIGARWFSDPHELRFDNGSILELGSCERDADAIKYQSSEFQLICFDEASQLSWFQIRLLNARVRSADPTIPKCLLFLTNPGGECHAELKATFVDAADPNTPFTASIGGGEGEGPPSTFSAIFIPAKLEDNPALLENDPAYRTRLMALPENIRRAWLDGSWDIYSGMYFSEWRREVHVIPPFELPRSWPRWRALDYGYANPFGCLWAARDNDGNIYIYREAYEKNLTDRQQAAVVLDLSRDDPPVRFTVADPSIFSRQPNGTSIAQEYLNVGLRCIPANNDRKSGWNRVHEYLRWSEAQKPRLRIFSNCRNLIRTLPIMQHDRWHVEDLDTHLEDHLADCTRYLLSGASVTNRSARLLEFEIVA